MTRLGKAQVEALLAGYDAAPVQSLTIALRAALDAPALEWAELIALADMSDQRRQALLNLEQAALDDLAAELNELREVAARRPAAPARPADRNRPQ